MLQSNGTTVHEHKHGGVQSGGSTTVGPRLQPVIPG
ncbi:hypothetical protein [Klebsiella michiganensis]